MHLQKEQLIQYFTFNDWANRKFLDSVFKIPDNEELLELFSHLINSQNKWMNRICAKADDTEYEWFSPVYKSETIGNKWKESLEAWLFFLDPVKENDLDEFIFFTRQADQKKLKVKIRDVAFQLNCHSIHHRAQMAKMIRAKGFAPPAADYIFTTIEEA